MPSEPPTSVISPELFAQAIRLGDIFMPHAARQRKEYFNDERRDIPTRMVHYTTAEAALNIRGMWRHRTFGVWTVTAVGLTEASSC